MKPSPFRTAEDDTIIARRLQRRQILEALGGSESASRGIEQLIDAHRFYQERRQHVRRGRPEEDLRKWFLRRVRQIFRAARVDGAFAAAETEFVRLVAGVARIPLPPGVRDIVDKPLGPIAERQRAIERIAQQVRLNRLRASGDKRPQRGSQSDRAKEIREMRDAGATQAEIVRTLGYSPKTVRKYFQSGGG